MALVIQEAGEAHQRIKAFLEQEEALYRELGARLRKANPAFVFSLARGSSDHAMTYAGYLIPTVTGRIVASLPPSVTTVLNSQLQVSGQICITVSQSGSSPDILASLRAAKTRGAITIGISNNSNSPLAVEAEHFLNQHAGPEIAVAATKTVLCTQAVLARLAAHWGDDKKLLEHLRALPEQLRAAFDIGNTFPAQDFSSISHVYVISRSLGMGAAYEMALKIKEMCGIHAEAYSSAEVRHGPREIVNERYLVIGLPVPGSGPEDVLLALQELKAQGAKTLTIGFSESSNQVSLDGKLDHRLLPIVALNYFYPWLARSAASVGRDPDRPKILQSKVVHTL